jgi:hypothetical protein
MDSWFFSAACLAMPLLGVFAFFLFKTQCEEEVVG